MTAARGGAAREDAPRRFAVEVDGTTVAGHLYGAAGDRPRPAVLLCPGFSGTQDTPALVAAARAFAAAGLLAATVDYRGFGLSAGAPRQVVSVRDQVADVRAALRHLRTVPGVDPERVALWGTSLGGGHVLTVAAGAPEVAAVVAQVPFNGFPRRVEGRSAGQACALLWMALRDRVRGWLGRRPLYVKAVGTAEEHAVMIGAQARTTVADLRSPTWRNEVAPRGLLDMMGYRPGRTVHRITAPLLVCVATRDRETVAATIAGLADDAPDGTMLRYDVSHFDVYRLDVRDRVLRDQVEFLHRALR